jgi:rhodanese-related sulfurtransferase
MLRHPSGTPSVPEIEPRSAWDKAQRGEAIIVDVREDDEVAEIAVPGATHIPLGLLRDRVSELPRDGELLLICHSGQRSSMATRFLRDEGFAGATNITGGIVAWFHAGLPTHPSMS